ncbi:MAG TPA: DMT family transporter [Candidatus Binataceae bacterium]|nr:DMT family transporter [Candidatus Binataceae bacterium]
MTYRRDTTLTQSTAAVPLTSRPKTILSVGFAFAASNVLISALQPVITRYGALKIDALLFCGISVLFAAVCAAVMLALTGELWPLADRRYLPRLFLVSMSGTVATTLTLIYGLQHLDAVAAVILLESEPIYSLLMARVFLHERPSQRQLIATATILSGIGWVFGGGRAFEPIYAAALIVVTPMFWQTAHVISLGVMPPLTPRVITGARYIYAALVFAVILLVLDRPALPELASPAILAPIAFTGMFVYFVGSFTWYGAISRLSLAWTTAFVIPAIPIVSFIFAMVFLGERPSSREIAGIAVAVTGVLLLVIGTDSSRGPVTAPAVYE